MPPPDFSGEGQALPTPRESGKIGGYGSATHTRIIGLLGAMSSKINVDFAVDSLIIESSTKENDMKERLIDPPEGKAIPMPMTLVRMMQEEDNHLFIELAYEEMYEHTQEIFDMCMAQDGQGIIKKLEDMMYDVGNSGAAIEWFEDRDHG
jgi:hypothetical protein